MSEIRTCEDYVVSELLETKDRVDALTEDIEELKCRLSKLEEPQNLIEKHIQVNLRKSEYRSMKYIDISSTIWSDNEDYDVILNILAGRGYDFADEDEGKTE